MDDPVFKNLDSIPTPSERICKFCKMDFTGKNSRPKHYLEHIEKCKKFRPFIENDDQCKFCKKTFNQIGNLFNHLEKFHAKEVETEMKKQKNFQCSKGAFIKYVCLASFWEKGVGDPRNRDFVNFELELISQRNLMGKYR